jgi:hypothetical protein
MESDHTWFRRLERIAAQMIAEHLSKPDASAPGNA